MEVNGIVFVTYIKDARKRRVYSGRKKRATGSVYLQGSLYCDG